MSKQPDAAISKRGHQQVGLAVLRSKERRGISWPDIERAVLLRIGKGNYVVGQKLPTCEELATEFGANKNTVNRAYRALAERGYVVAQAGTGTFVNKRPPRLDHDHAVEAVRSLVALAVQEAKLAGLTEPDFRSLLHQVVRAAYSSRKPQIGFIECNKLDAATLSRDIQDALHHPVEPLLIEDVVADPDSFCRKYDILAVNLVHLSELEAALSRLPSDDLRTAVFGLHVPIDPESLTRVARLRQGTRLGIICDLEQTLASLAGLVAGCNRTIAIRTCLSQKRTELRRLVRSCDVLLVTPSAMDRVTAVDPQVPIISIAFRPDARSVVQLGVLLSERTKFLETRAG